MGGAAGEGARAARGRVRFRVPRGRPGAAAFRPRAEAGVVPRHRLVGGSEECRPAVRQQQHALAEPADDLHVVRHEEHGGAGLAHPLDPLHALLLEEDVADAQGLVDDEHVGVEAGEHAEGQADEHAAAVEPDRAVEEAVGDLGERLDLRQFLLRVVGAEGEQAGAVDDVLPAGQVGVQARAKLQEAEHAAGDAERALGGVHGAGEDLEQGALAGPVDADDPERLAAGDLE
jgi:hypothetical protein